MHLRLKKKGNLCTRLPFAGGASGVEPLTSSMRTRRTTNCANAPYRNAMLLYNPLIKKSIPFLCRLPYFRAICCDIINRIRGGTAMKQTIWTPAIIAKSALIAAIYGGHGLLSGMGFGQVQIRIAEALYVLALYTLSAVPG